MHLNKILEQIKRHQSPTEAIDKLATAIKNPEIDVTHLLDISNYQIIYKSIKL